MTHWWLSTIVKDERWMNDYKRTRPLTLEQVFIHAAYLWGRICISVTHKIIQLNMIRLKDQKSIRLSKEFLEIFFEGGLDIEG